MARVVEKKPELKDALRARPMSVLSGTFLEQGVARIEGTLAEEDGKQLFNEELFPSLPIIKEDVVEKLSFFVKQEGTAEMIMLGLPEHGRTLSLNIRFADSHHNVYSYINFKGIGMPKYYMEKSSYRDSFDYIESTKISKGGGVFGLEDYESARADWTSSNWLIRNGLETSGPLAIIELGEILAKNGKTADIESLRKDQKIPEMMGFGGGLPGITTCPLHKGLLRSHES